MDNFWKDKKVLITGASGFVGTNAVRYFNNLGCCVRAVVHTKASLDLFKDLKNVEVLNLDLINPKDSKIAVKGQQYVFNFAAVDGGASFKNKFTADIFSQNIRINLNMLDASAKSSDLIAFLLVSSVDIYAGDIDEVDENSKIDINWESKINGYKLAKWSSELAAREYKNQFGLDSTIIRPSNLYGPHDEFENQDKLRFIPTIIRKALVNEQIEIWGDGKQIRSYLYIDDFLVIIRKLISERAYNTPINIASSKYQSLKVIARQIVEITNSNSAIVVDEEKPGGPKSRKVSIEKLKNIIGDYNETDFRIGIKRTIDRTGLE